MPITTFSGRIKDAAGGAIHMSISGPNHFFFSNSYTADFDESVDLGAGVYDVAVSVYTDGTFTFYINSGKVSPPVPDKYTSKVKEDYTLIVSDNTRTLLAKATTQKKKRK